MSAELRPAGLFRLLAWLSPAYPLGSFSYSGGLEQAVESGLVRDAGDLQGWIRTVLGRGSGRVEAALYVAAWRAAEEEDGERLSDLAALGAAWRAGSEAALESMAQGTAFLAATCAAWPDPGLLRFAARQGGRAPLPVALGVACAGQEVPLAEGLAAYLQALAANLVSAGVRLIPLGQTDGLHVLAGLQDAVAAAAAAAIRTALDEVGTAAPLQDWCGMHHETQYTRLFRS